MMDTPDDTSSEATNDGSAQEWVVAPGTEVVDSAGHSVGRVDDIRDGYLVVRKGRFFAADYYIPFGAIGSHDESTIYLNVVADDAAGEIWHRRPAPRGRDDAAATDPSAMDTEERLEYLTDAEGNVRVPIIREELAATRRPVVRGRVRIETRISEHEETLEVPVTEERVRIQRRSFDRDGTGSDITVDGGTFEIPFYGEDVDVERRVRVIEEIIITREAVETVRRVRGTVRTETAEVFEDDIPEHNLDPRDLESTRVPETTAVESDRRDDD